MFPAPRLPALHAALLLLLAVLPALAHGQASAGNPSPPETLHFPSGGTEIRVDRYAPAAVEPPVGKRPAAVLVFNGAGGTLLDGLEMRRVAGALAASGRPAYVVHYFNRTNTVVARDAVLRKLYVTWLPTARDAVAFVHEREGDQPVGLYGYSLGAFLAVAVAGDNPRVGAVVEQDGGIWNSQEANLGRHVPPVLMVHGREDRRVPFVEYAVPLQGFLRRRGTVVETRFVPGEGHSFSAPAQAGVRAATVEFFDRHLRGGGAGR